MASAQNSSVAAGPEWVTVPCPMCTNQCGLNLGVENGRITQVKGWDDHPRSRGKICVKATQIPALVAHEDRLRAPMKKENGRWRQVTWDEALDTVAAHLKDARAQYGPASLGVLLGEPCCMAVETEWFMTWRFCDVYGTPNRFEVADLCGFSPFTGQIATFGYLIEPDIAHSDCIVLWGTNPPASDPILAGQVAAAIDRGAKLIVIDPRRTPFARRADAHVKVWPGTDGMLALAMIHVIIAENLYDADFVTRWTVGFDRLAEHVRGYTPEKAAGICGVSPEEIVTIARMFATSPSACIRSYFRTSFGRDGWHTHRAFYALSAITGNIETRGGELRTGYTQFAPSRPVRLPALMGDLKYAGEVEYPIYKTFMPGFKDGTKVNWGDLVLDEPQQVRNMIIAGANPAVTWPNTPKVKKALEKLDFLVAIDPRMSVTAQMADIVLPPALHVEKPYLVSYHGIFLGRKVVEPPPGVLTDCQIWSELGKRLGFEEYFPWNSDEEAFNYFFEPLTMQKILQENPTGFLQYNVVPGERQYRELGFPTASGKIELYSERVEQFGGDPLPIYQGPVDSPTITADPSGGFPLILNTGHMQVEYWHSQYRNLPALRQRVPRATAEIHPDSAGKYGIGHGERMIIETKIGALEIEAEVTENIAPGVVSIAHAWEDALANLITDDAPVDPISGFPAFTGLVCRVRPVKSSGG